MQPVLRRGLTVFITLLILSPVAYLLAVQTRAVTEQVSPLDFVPRNCTEVISINEGQSHMIIYNASSEIGYILKTSPWFLYNMIQKHNPKTNTNITFSQATVFHATKIYRLSNIQPISIVANSSIGNALDNLNVTNKTVVHSKSALFFSNPRSDIFILGSLGTVERSLHQSISRDTGSPIYSSLNTSAAISFVIRSPIPGYINHISGNLTGNTLSVKVSFSHSLYAADFFALYLLSLLGKGIVIVPVSIYTDEMNVNLNSMQFLPFFSLLQNALGGM